MRLDASVCVCVYVTKKMDLFSALPFEKILLSILHFLLMIFKHLQSRFLRPVFYRLSNLCLFY